MIFAEWLPASFRLLKALNSSLVIFIFINFVSLKDIISTISGVHPLFLIM